MTPLWLLFALSAPSSHAETCLSRVAAQVTSLRASFPRLDGLNLVLETFDSREDFYRARPRSAWRPPRERVYAVLVNMAMCADPPPPEAEKAILAHELAHIDAYSVMGRRALLGLGWAYLVRPGGKAVEAFEKQADDTAIRLGHAQGLAVYREWLFPRIPPKAAALKRRLYRTPEELRSKFPKMPS